MSTILANIVLDYFHRGGPIMWPIVGVAVLAIAVVLERIVWWTGQSAKRDRQKLIMVLGEVEKGRLEDAAELARTSEDPVLRMLAEGLGHHHISLQGALQVAAGVELERAGRFLSVLDTLITLAPLLGLLGTVMGIMGSFSFVGQEDLAVQKVSGGIGEALIATACGLGIAIFCLVPYNYFGRRVSRLRFELETNATNLELMVGKAKGVAQ